MSLFDKLLGKKKTPPAGPIDPRDNPNLIQVFDEYGRELFITKEEWRKNVLPGSIKSGWDKPDELASVVIGTIRDGWAEDVLGAAERLHQIDPNHARSACVYGIVLMELGKLDKAEAILQGYIEKYGEEGSVLTNLAKVYAQRKNEAKSNEILWRALEVDPNQENGLGWFTAIHFEKGGENARHDALRKLAALPGSWRAQVWLGRYELEKGHLEKALAYYQESLTRAGDLVEADVLMQISGDLGKNGHINEIIRVVEPHFVPKVHALQVGNNLLKAHLELKQVEEAEKILNQLYALKRPDLKPGLQFWDTEIAKAKLAPPVVVNPDKPLSMSMLLFEGPIWLKPTSPVRELFPIKAQDGPSISFLGSSAEMTSKNTDSGVMELQLADAPGRLSRGLPLYFAEMVHFNLQASVQTFMPLILGDAPGFMVSGGPFEDKTAVDYARKGPKKTDYLVLSHIKTGPGPWHLTLRLVRTTDGMRLGELETSFDHRKPEEAIPALADQLLVLLNKVIGVNTQTPPAAYQVPLGDQFPNYLLRLEQLMAVRSTGKDQLVKWFMHGEREILNGNIELCLSNPQNTGVRVLMAQTMLAMKKDRPDILLEFKDKVALLQKKKPLPEPAQSMVNKILDEVFV